MRVSYDNTVKVGMATKVSAVGWTCKSALLGRGSVGPARGGEGDWKGAGRCRSCMASQYT